MAIAAIQLELAFNQADRPVGRGTQGPGFCHHRLYWEWEKCLVWPIFGRP